MSNITINDVTVPRNLVVTQPPYPGAPAYDLKPGQQVGGRYPNPTIYEGPAGVLRVEFDEQPGGPQAHREPRFWRNDQLDIRIRVSEQGPADQFFPGRLDLLGSLQVNLKAARLVALQLEVQGGRGAGPQAQQRFAHFERASLALIEALAHIEQTRR